ncbi:MAG: hypothetical protein V4591_03840, partial [Bdellovibrionota bacterium]
MNQILKPSHPIECAHFFGGEFVKGRGAEFKIDSPYFGEIVGIAHEATQGELEAALEKAFKEDTQVLAEEFISGREFTIGVFRSKGKIITLPITEIKSQ